MISPLHYIIKERNYFNLLKLNKLVEAGADLNEQNNEGHTALTIAI